MTFASHPLKPRCLCLDIETARQDSLHLREIGAVRPDTGAKLRISGKAKDLSARLDDISLGAAFVLGHNVVAFDQPALALLHPGLFLHSLPLVDTLELSPLAFPQNPYHRLVKDYKLCTTTRNDPVRDAELAYELFLEQREALLQRVAEQPDDMLCLHFLLAPESGRGVASFFATLRNALRPTLAQAQAAWLKATTGKVCSNAQHRVAEDCFPDANWHKPLAYVLAWLRVAGGNSVLPPWVGNQFPQTKTLIKQLRDVPCGDPACEWCSEQHDLKKLLARYFAGIPDFRATPTTADGRSLQQTIVEHGFASRPMLAILPTGGGKSLCYQLPALARYYRSGSLTVVISPLQSLMKDQVDNLEARGIACAGYLNSLLNPLERRVVLDKLRLGDLGLIFVAPEQFRSSAFANALAHRDVGAWVFDEAHCLSKWGHDFRPDYLYVSRFIKSRQKDKPSPVFCFTATAKPDVVADIVGHFKQRLDMELAVLSGGVSRDNLNYEVHAVPAQAKYPAVLSLLEAALRGDGGAIVFCARHKTVEEMAEFLTQAGLDCGHFHGGMPPERKRRMQEAFIAGELRVIAATNAFGMGVDKADVRLVIHLDTPGSLENYLQEAGRAGRDQAPARCILLYDDADLDVQFRLLRNSRLTQQDIYAILKALRSIERKDRSEGSVVVTSGEILLEIPDKHGIDPDAADADTKVRIAVAWLEEARLLERQENHTRVFPGCLQVATLDEAGLLLKQKLGPNADPEPYLAVLAELLNAGDDEGISTDDLILATGQPAQVVQNLLRDLDRFKLVSNDAEIGVSFYRDPDTVDRLADLVKLEDALVNCLREAAPDADLEQWQMLQMRRLCDTLRRDAGVELEPDRLTRLLKAFAETFGDDGDKSRRGFFALRPGGPDHRYVKLLRDWRQIEHIRAKRMRLAQALVGYFAGLRQGNNLLVTCKQGVLEAALQSDLTLQDLEISDWQRALAAALLYLDANEVLHLARGKAIFRSAMHIQLNPEARHRQFKNADYAELALHYKDKIIQVHVMAEYAKLALGKIQAAMSFIVDYFGMERAEFVRRYFAGREDILEMATSEAAHRRILTDLKNPEQQAIVAAPPDANLLVLAGPGAGKTKVIVHRVAWLLREALVAPDAIMVLTYNRAAAVEIRRRLWALAGADAAGVTVQTLHTLALRLTGTSCAVAAERGEVVDFAAVIKNAAANLRRADENEEAGASARRDRLLAGLRYVLVDEYQDINADHYDLISALAGRTLSGADDKLTLMAVGDDDQNIYAFNAANVRFIRQFEVDYQAKVCYLVENYRSTGQIIACANRVITGAKERMKREQLIRIDHFRRDQPAGGEFEALDPLTLGRVHILKTPSSTGAELAAALAELKRLNALRFGERPAHWGRFAVIARHWQALEPLAALCRSQAIPARMLRDDELPALHGTREGAALLALLSGQSRKSVRPEPFGFAQDRPGEGWQLKAGHRRESSGRRLLIRHGALSRWFKRRYGQSVTEAISHPYRAMLAQFIADSEVSSTDNVPFISPLPGGRLQGSRSESNVRNGCREGPGVRGQGRLVAADLIEALYEFGSGRQARFADGPHAPLLLLTAHRAKGLEFDHVLILDAGGWQQAGDDERRLFYVAMTRARNTLTLCQRQSGRHAFAADCAPLCLTSTIETIGEPPEVRQRRWLAGPEHVFLSWPGYFAASHTIHRAIAALDYGDPLTLRPRGDGKPGWELADANGTTVSRMAQAFVPPQGAIVAVRVAGILARNRKPGDSGDLRCERWEVVLAEVEYLAG
ncbi:RecQ family ATP-dependent DNA helicase [Methylomonas sp. LWB]|uniref:RecQ family ATP-dependent DNA helicase n=1 Tax=Methylomonas sp. LWB TaxID=1905845 RepID=UPI0009F63017|nr:RecQ family ATP-dependent DNA helicase [Methylomonas sp. LWB]